MNSENCHTWRFIDTGAADGPFNMAVDEALVRFVNSSSPILRFYRWQPFTISVGYHQSLDDIDLNKCQKNGVDVVRRPTGGRAVFHAHEVTYSVTIPERNSLFHKSSAEIYNQISSALVCGLKKLDTQVKIDKIKYSDTSFSQYHRHFACFASTAKYEIQFQAKKLVGSAQRRFENGLLQHGSILLNTEHLNLMDYLTPNGNGEFKTSRNQLLEKTVCIETILNRSVSFEEVVNNLKTGFEKYFRIKFQNIPLTKSELHKIDRLKRNYIE